MTDPLVCAILLTKDRPEMAKRAVECFKKQTYRNKRVLIYDTGREHAVLGDVANDMEHFRCFYNAHRGDLTIGQLRNEANGHTDDMPYVRPDILIHWDDDDYSHPSRISEQVALLQASGKQCVGYRDMLFWREPQSYAANPAKWKGEAWLYHNNDPRYCLGTSLCYWRDVWQKRPFPNISRGEDKAWLREVDSLSVSSLFIHGEQKHPDDCECGTCGPGRRTVIYGGNCEPRMIASIHSGNHVVYEPEKSSNFSRVPEWDAYCRETMVL